MKCPYCGSTLSKVLNSRPVEETNSIRRRRQCEDCEMRFTTYERVEVIPIIVVKRNKTREPFDREKLLRGIMRSCNKRIVTLDQIEDIVDQIENIILNSSTKEVSSIELGEMVMEKLKEIDEVSYIRFASVYKQFKDINEFILELEKIKKGKI
ncbi:MAG TPA: transcriptional repressor NrdR [Epulopiscium sp.]|nr:transcriptional repressor NrdR [Candidatus Epulonipiscium sp.]